LGTRKVCLNATREEVYREPKGKGKEKTTSPGSQGGGRMNSRFCDRAQEKKVINPAHIGSAKNTCSVRKLKTHD